MGEEEVKTGKSETAMEVDGLTQLTVEKLWIWKEKASRRPRKTNKKDELTTSKVNFPTTRLMQRPRDFSTSIVASNKEVMILYTHDVVLDILSVQIICCEDWFPERQTIYDIMIIEKLMPLFKTVFKN